MAIVGSIIISLLTSYLVSLHVISWQNNILRDNARHFLDDEISDSIEFLEEDKFVISPDHAVYIPLPLLNAGTFWKSVGINEREWAVNCDPNIPVFYENLELLQLNYFLASQAYLSRNGPSTEFKAAMGKLQMETLDFAKKALAGVKTCK